MNISVISLLGVVFVTLKLVGVIDWSWWFVTMPFWFGFAIFFIIFFIALIADGSQSNTKSIKRRKF